MFPTSIIQQTTAEDTVLHLGPGVLYDEINYNGAQAQILIVEPNTIQAHFLKKKLREHKRIHIIEKGIAFEQGDVVYHIFNFPYLNSLRMPTGLEELFAGLKLYEDQVVSPLQIPELLGLLPRRHRANDILIIDALGEAFDVLCALENAGALSRFSHIIMRTTSGSYFKGAASLDEISEWLGERWRAKPIPLDISDPDFPIVYFQKNVAAAKIAEDLADASRNSLTYKNDLCELQEQFAKITANKEQLENLLPKVTERLSEVLDFMNRLSTDPKFDAIDPKLRTLLGVNTGSAKTRKRRTKKKGTDKGNAPHE